ncbi:MAG TPA: molecular chaperone HtpG [Candidatus Onthovicinus excrementipullorum]|nr:molecular chaperone HtpG [Candidatus Onthovicinus excrementipullorum]
MAKKQFKAESKRLLDLMIHSIYTNKEIFLRELISNASDAIDKLAYRSLTDDSVTLKHDDYRIDLKIDKENGTLTVSDNGIGMDAKSLEENLGVIAKSGSLAFKQAVQADKEHPEADAADIIGQFGVGFYSAFMVADQVTVISRAYGADEANRWESNGADGYTITPCARDAAGTDVIMKIKADTEDYDYTRFLDPYTLQGLVKKYSDYIRWPIKMDMTKTRPVEKKEGDDDKDAPSYEEYTENVTLNSMVPLWHKNPKEVSDDDYAALYREKFGAFDRPLKTIHISTEGVVSYEALLFIPSAAPFDYYSKDYERGLQLYSNGVLIMDKCADLIPEYFRFIRGIVDTQDVSLNISREMLQESPQVRAISRSIEKKIRRELTKMLEKDRETYEKFFQTFGLQLKFGVVSDYGENKDDLKDLLLFKSSFEGKLVTIKEYISRMPEAQKDIYYACAQTVDKAKALPQAEALLTKGYEVLYLTDDADEFVMKTLLSEDGKNFVNVREYQQERTDEEKEQEKQQAQALEGMLGFVKEKLGGKVADVKLSNALGSHPVSLASQGGITLEMEQYFSRIAMENAPKADKVLELNPEHPLVKKLSETYESDADTAAKYAQLLYNQAMLMAGFEIEDPTAYTDLLCSLLA